MHAVHINIDAGIRLGRAMPPCVELDPSEVESSMATHMEAWEDGMQGCQYALCNAKNSGISVPASLGSARPKK